MGKLIGKPRVLLLILVVAMLAAGCGSEIAGIPQAETTTEGTGNVENSTAVSVDQDSIPRDTSDWLDAYMTTVEEQSDTIRASLEQEELTQVELDAKSQELFELWDDALNYLWDALENVLPEGEFEDLLDEQRIWIAEKEDAVAEAGKEFEGGSLYSLIMSGEAARITEERVYELYELLKQSKIH